MNYGEMLLSKVVDNNDPAAIKRFGIEPSHLETEGERKALAFINEYARTNRGQAPDYRTLVANVKDFTYVPNVEDSFDYVVKQLKGKSAKLQFQRLMETEAPKKFSEMPYEKFSDWLQESVESIKIGTSVRKKVGTDIKAEHEKFLKEYRDRKEGKSFKIWGSHFPTINKEVGGFMSGNMYTWYGRSGRGKSVFTMFEAIEAAFQGAKVLIWAMEMSRFEWMARAYSAISAREGYINASIEGVDYEVGFENKALLMGKLTEEFEKGFEVFLLSLNDILPGEIILRAADDEDFYDRSVKQLENDITETKADVVVIDAIYHMDYEINTSKVAGGDVANTSKKLRRMAGYTSTVLHVITQAEEVKDDVDEDGNRELRAAKRSEIKKTKAVLEDATTTFGIDSTDNRGIIELGKGRNGGEGITVEVTYLPNYGIVRELDTGEAIAEQFSEVF